MSEHQPTLPPAIFLMGPTASGKTGLAIELCKHLPCEIISVDSALIYRGMDIGTAKPTLAEQAQAPHRLIDILDPAQSYSAADFRRDALREMADITAAGKIPLLVGGTMLYFKALLEGLADMPETDPEIRVEITALAAEHGWPYIHSLLAEVDPDSAARIHPNHSQRLERALAIYRSGGITMTELHRQQSNDYQLPYQLYQLAISPLDRKVLHCRIEQRFQLMLEQGFEREITMLHERGDLDGSMPAMRAVGYRQLWQYLEGEHSLAQAVELAIIATRQLAKRQFTWLNGWSQIDWLHTDADGKLVVSEQTKMSAFGLEGHPPLALALKYLSNICALPS